MLRVGLTGPIAAGKSAVSARLRGLGVTVVDDDELAHEAIAAGTPGAAAVQARFGDGVMKPDGSVDRAALGRLVFADAQALDALEAIVHPAVAARARQLDAAARERGEALIVHDIPLLAETGQQDQFDQVLVVDAPADVRLTRLVEGRGLDEAEARRRMAAQATSAERNAIADVVFDGSGTLAGLWSQVDAWLASVLTPPPDSRLKP
jgi:dephospho-CoA kinase